MSAGGIEHKKKIFEFIFSLFYPRAHPELVEGSSAYKNIGKQMQVMNHQIQPNQIWRHYKNKDYRIIAISLHTEDLTWYVVYEALYDNEISKIWHRPLEMFLENIEIDGNIVPRFRHVK